jgi:hypothetical protein
MRRRHLLTSLLSATASLCAPALARAAWDGSRGTASVGQLRVRVTVTENGQIFARPFPKPTGHVPQRFEIRVCDGQSQLLTLCHSFGDNALLTVAGPSDGRAFVTRNGNQTLPIEVLALTPAATIPLNPNVPTPLGSHAAEDTPSCPNTNGTAILLRPLAACPAGARQPFHAELTFRLEAA